MAKALFRSLTVDIVRAALDMLHDNVSPGDDGIGAKKFKVFAEQFVPRMHELLEHCLNEGCLPKGWEHGLLNCIPTLAGMALINKLRPIASQDVKMKWMMNIICI